MVRLSCMVAPMAVALLAIWTHIGVSASPPGPVIKCTSGNINCTVTKGYGSFPDWTTCQVASVAYPANESKLLIVVSNASMNKQKMKAVLSVYSHNIPKLSCPGGPSGAGLAISTMRLNHVVSVNSTRIRRKQEEGSLSAGKRRKSVGISFRGSRQVPIVGVSVKDSPALVYF